MGAIQEKDWRIKIGATFLDISLTFLDSNNQPVDLGGYTAKLVAKTAPDDTVPQLICFDSSYTVPAWSISNPYVFGDVVVETGSYYFCLVNNTGNDPQNPNPNDATVYWKQTAAGIVTLGGTLGTVDVVVGADQTALLTVAPTMAYDLFLYNGVDDTVCAMQGRFVFIQKSNL